MVSRSPEHKRIRLDPSASPSPPPQADNRIKVEEDDSPSRAALREEQVHKGHVDPTEVEEEEDHCVICLHRIRDRTVLPCAHDRLCFECILVWTVQSRKCPLCNASIGTFLIHNLRSKYDYQKHYLPPLRESSPPDLSAPFQGGFGNTPHSRGRGRTAAVRWGTRTRNRSLSRERREMEDELGLAIERRRWVYRHGLYAKHVASNPYTRYRPAPTPAQITASPDIISRATIFVRRELRVWVNLDVEFLTTFILSLMKTLDLRSESAVKLLAEFLDMDTPYHVVDTDERSGGRFTNAEQFAHELYSYLRSPFRELATYDSAVQYDTPAQVPPAPSRPPTSSARRQWDLHSPAHAETSSRLRRHSSPSPVSLSPRDAYSRSPSRIDFDDYEPYGPPLPPRSAEHSRPGASADTGAGDRASKVDRDRKGKGREHVNSSAETGTHYKDHDHARQAHRSRKRSPSAGRSPPRVGYHPRTSWAAQERSHRRSPPHTTEYGRRRSYHDREGHQDSPLSPNPPSQSHDSNGQGKPTALIPIYKESGAVSPGQPNKDDQQESKLEPAAWGISIKGQAKNIDLIQKPDTGGRGSRNIPKPDETNHVAPASKKHTRKLLDLDVLHAHLTRESGSRSTSAKVGALTGVTTDPSASGSLHAEVSQGTRKDATSLVRAENDAHQPSLLSRVSDPSTSVTPSQSLPTSQRSAREIMAQTRARLARMKSQPPLPGTASEYPSAPPPSESVGQTSLLNTNLRARLLERLEEEKMHATAQPNGEQASDINEQKGEREMTKGLTSDSQQAEIKLRAQALLRVRLAAEKRKAGTPEDESAMSREEGLRAKLLSRRT